MVSDNLSLVVVLLASAGLGLLVYGVVALFAPEWAHVHLLPLLLTGGGVLPLYVGLRLKAWWNAESVAVRLDHARAWANELANQARELELAAFARITETDDDPPEPDAQAWRLALETFFRAGELAGGFSIRKLDGVVGSDTWALLTDFYASPAGRGVLRVAGGDVGTVWNYGWGLDFTLQQLSLGKLPRPAGPVPEVKPFVANTTQRNAQRQRKTAAGAVVEGQVVGK